MGADTSTPDERARQAVQRLQASRARLARAWQPSIEAPSPKGRGHHRLAAMVRLARRALAGIPLAAPVLDVLSRTWQRHPWRPVIEVITHEARATLVPVVRRHPLTSVLAAAGVAAAVVAWRPAALLRPGRWAWRRLRRLPLASLLASALVSGAAMSASSDTPRRPAPMPPAPPDT